MCQNVSSLQVLSDLNDSALLLSLFFFSFFHFFFSITIPVEWLYPRSIEHSRLKHLHAQLPPRHRRRRRQQQPKGSTFNFQHFLEKMRQPSAGELVSSIKAFIYEQSKQSSRQLLVSEYERYRWLARIVQLDVFFSFRTRARALSVHTHSRDFAECPGLRSLPNVLLLTVSDFSDVVHQRLIQEFLAETTDRLAGHELWKDATVSSHRHFLRAFFSRTPTIYISCKFTAVPTRLIHSYIKQSH